MWWQPKQSLRLCVTIIGHVLHFVSYFANTLELPIAFLQPKSIYQSQTFRGLIRLFINEYIHHLICACNIILTFAGVSLLTLLLSYTSGLSHNLNLKVITLLVNDASSIQVVTVKKLYKNFLNLLSFLVQPRYQDAKRDCKLHHVCPPDCRSPWNNSARIGQIFINFYIWSFYQKCVEKMLSWLKSANT